MNKQLFEIIRYSIYCHFFECDPSDPGEYRDYLQFWKTEALEDHCGDCTNQPCPCIRCQADLIDGDAQKAFDAINVTISFNE